MSNYVHNVSKGRFHSDFIAAGSSPAGVIARLNKQNETPSGSTSAQDRLTFQGLIDNGTLKCDATNYADELVGSPSFNVDHTNDRVDVDCADITFDGSGSGIGGAVNNSIVGLITGIDADTGTGNDTNIRPMTNHDLTLTTDGSVIVLTVNGVARASNPA